MRDIITKLEELNVEIVTEGYEKQVLNVCKAEGIDCSFRDGNLHLDKEDMSAAREAIKDADMEVPKMIAEGLGELAHEAEKDHEVQMARSDLYKIAKYAVAIHKMLKDRSEMDGLEGWVQSKITKSADYMGAVKHYMEGEIMADVELAVVPVAGDMTDAMTMPQESIEEGKMSPEEDLEEGRNDGPMSECCDAPLDGYENGLGRCSDCGEMAGAWNADELDEAVEEEMNEEDVIGDIIANLQKVGVGKKGKTPQKPRMALPKPKPAEPIGSNPETGATKGLPPEEVYSPQQLQQIANQNRITKPALKKESKFADWSKK